MSITIVADGLLDLGKYLDAMPNVATHAAYMAINQVAQRKAIPIIRTGIMEQVEFSSSYLNADRLNVTRKATSGNLEAVIGARSRPTSLARFAKGQTPESTRKGGVSLLVKPGQPVNLKKAFLVKLNAGKSADENFNVGLAVRLKPGESIKNKTNASSTAHFSPNVYLLYGPSVDQVFKTVAVDVGPLIAEDLSAEFVRQFVRLSGA